MRLLRGLMVIALGVPLGTMLAPVHATAATSGCISGVAVTQFAFNPASVPAGSNSTLTLVLQNCTNQAITGSTDWYGHYVDAAGNLAANCAVLDPLPFSYSIAPGGTYTRSSSYGAPPSAATQCQPAGLQINANINVSGVGTTQVVSAVLQFTSACGGGVAVAGFGFNPPTVNTGQLSTATLVLRNCTTQTVQGQTLWTFQFTGSGSGIPPGCPATDPLVKNYTIAPGGTTTVTQQAGNTIPGCSATGMKANVNVTVTGTTGTVATASGSLTIVPAAGPTCHVVYSANQWSGGFVANVTINNTSSTAVTGWTLAFAFQGDQTITSAWNATVSQTRQNVTATNTSYNATIPAGGSQSFGFQGTWTSSAAAPLAFSLNGVACT